MTKIIMILLLVIISGTGGVRASGFNLKSIGAVTTEGKQISHWWYTGTLPVFRGIADPGAAVTTTIDGTALVINADSAGDWVFTPVSSLAGGDHNVSFVSGGSTISFTLTLGNENVDWTAVQNGSGEALPAAGTSWPTIVMVAIGLAGMGFSAKMIRAKN